MPNVSWIFLSLLEDENANIVDINSCALDVVYSAQYRLKQKNGKSLNLLEDCFEIY